MFTEYPASREPLELYMFAVDEALEPSAAKAGISGLIIDWENDHKEDRQRGRDTQINHHTLSDLDRVVRSTRLPITVRVNGSPEGLNEIDVAIDHGASQIMLPMARSAREVERFLTHVRGRAETLVQIETQSLVEDCAALKNLEWNRAFIGLNDLMISRGGTWLWDALYDGTVDQVCTILAGRRLGFGGVTIVGGGEPLRLTDLMREYGRLGCSFSFLRRTFFREIAGRELELEMSAVHAMWQAVRHRNAAAIAYDHKEFVTRLSAAREELLVHRPRNDPPPHSHANTGNVRAV